LRTAFAVKTTIGCTSRAAVAGLATVWRVSSRRRASSDHRSPSGVTSATSNRMRSRRSPALSTCGLRACSENSNTKDARPVHRVRYPRAKATARAPASTNKAAWTQASPERACRERSLNLTYVEVKAASG